MAVQQLLPREVDHFLLVVLVQPVLTVLADQGIVELEEDKLAAEDEEFPN